MRIGIVGDSHGDHAALRRVLHANPLVDRWLHTGDWSQDAWLLAEESGLPVLAVAGNTDSPDGRAKEEELLNISGYEIWLIHGHRYLAYGKNALIEEAREVGADIVVYGHTHVPEAAWYGKILAINPGSPSRPRGGSKAGFAVLTLHPEEKPEVEFIYL